MNTVKSITLKARTGGLIMPRGAHFEQAEVSSRIIALRSHVGLLLVLALWVFASLAWVATASAGAITDSEELGRFGIEGAGAGQFYLPRGMASDAVTGHLYVADSANDRIDEFTAWGEFVKAWGWGVADGASKLETCITTCVSGLTGSGSGQFGSGSPFNIAVGAGGDVYALDSGNRRVQEFDPSGQFLLMFGGDVNKTKVEEAGSTPAQRNLCTAASGDECQAGTVGAGQGEFSEGVGLAISQTGTILVGDEGRIQEFEPDGSFKSEFKVSGTVNAIAPDPTGSDLYVLLRGQEDIHKLSSSGAEVSSLKVYEPQAIAIDAAGNLYVAQQRTRNEIVGGIQIFEMPQKVVEFNASGAEVSSCCIPAQHPSDGSGDRYTLTGLGTNAAGDLYVANTSNGLGNYIAFFGPPPVRWPPPAVPPSIVAQFSSSVDSTSATLKAQINPNYWADTRFYVEYGPVACASSPCVQHPVAPGSELGAGVVKKAVTSSGVVLAGLTPNTTYHYRFVAESSGGGPVRGVSGVVGNDGTEGAFTTFAAVKAPGSCTNDTFRIGLSVRLPDCRAYEMVSPIDKNNGDIKTLLDVTGYETDLDQAATGGEAFTYSSYRAFGGAEGGPYISQYLARRGGGGWQSEALGGPLTGTFYGARLLEDEFKAFSPDLCGSWLVPGGESALAPEAVAGLPNLYRRDNCPKGYEALTTVAPLIPRVPEDYIPELQGFSADGAKAIFRIDDNLTLDSAAQPGACNAEGVDCQRRLYESDGGLLKPVCVFPEGTSAKVETEFPNCSAGSPGDFAGTLTAINRIASVSHAMSEDGSRVYWSASAEPEVPGKVYVRVNGTTTLPVTEAPGEGQTTKPARFWGASPDGARALYVVADPEQKNPTQKDKSLYLYDLSAEESTLIAPKVSAVVATSEDLSRVYFVSSAVLAGTSGASAGKENLYLDDKGTDTFIATLSGSDVAQSVRSDGGTAPIFHAARATPDGGRLAFVSTEPLTGFDNTDLNSGEADSEVFSYDAVTGKLVCASCSPAGARPAGRSIATQSSNAVLWTAAAIPAPQTELNAPRALSDDGNKLFFTSYTDLLPADTNGKADVYEWEAVGSGSCKDESDPDYYPANGGCLFLISSGESPSDSELIDTGANGRDVFFTTNASLLPQDPGLIDVYDARVDGGFPPPSVPAAACEGEACQGAPVPPLDTTPASFAFSGPGNLIPPVLSTSKAKAKPKAKPCRKSTVRKKGKCVKKKQQQQQQRSARKGSAARSGRSRKSSRGIVKHNRRTPR